MVKYKEIANWFIAKIKDEELKKGCRLPTEDELCEQFSVSRQTIRNAMKVLEDNNYISRVRGSGSYVLWEKIPKEKTVGVMVAYMSPYVYPEIVRGIEQILTTKGYGMDLGFSHYSLEYERKYLQRMLDMNVSGLIVEGVKSALPNPNQDLYEELARREIPIIFIHNYYMNFPATSILMEDEKLAYEMTIKLIQAGHKKIMGCLKYDDIQGLNRYLGFAKAMTENGLHFENDYVFWFGDLHVEFNSVFDTYASLTVFEEICNKIGDATALVCYNDLIAASIIEKLSKRGYSVPEDISIVSFDDVIVQNERSVCLVSAGHPKEELGRCAAKEVLRQMTRFTDEDRGKKIYLPSEITMRNSIKIIQ